MSSKFPLGDVLMGYFILDERLKKRFKMLEPHYDAHSTTKPGSLNNTTDLPDNAVITLFNWVEQEELVITE